MVASLDTERVEPVKDEKKKRKPKKKSAKSGWLSTRLPGVRTVLFISAIFLILFKGYLPHHNYIDNKLFILSGGLKKEPALKQKTAIITLTAGEMNLLSRSPEALPEFIKVLKALKDKKHSAAALILDNFPQVRQNNQIEMITSQIKTLIKKAKPPEKRQLNELLQLSEKNDRTEFFKLIDDLKIVIGVRQLKSESYKNPIIGNFIFNNELDIRPASKRNYFDKLPDNALSMPVPEVNSMRINDNKKRKISPVLQASLLGKWPLVWKNGNEYIPDICTVMYSQTIKDTPEWEKETGVMFGFSFQETDSSGFVLPRYSSTLNDQIKKYSLHRIATLEKFNFLDKTAVFIGEETDPMLYAAASAFVCISSGIVSNTPYEAVWLEKFLIVIFLLYLVVIVPYLRAGSAALISTFAVLISLIILVGMHLVKDQWLLLTLPAIYLVAGNILMYIGQRKKEKVDGLRQKADAAFFNLGRFQFEQNRYDQAFDSLLECKPEKIVLELLYKLGVSLERKRQYDKACMVFEYINEQNAGYKDAGERAERLTNIIFGRTQVNPQSNSGTLVITAGGMNRPVLGRYEIEKELGRGAMGIVYLGEDPKIGRKIAIKTMDFTQTFEGRFDEVKERFFREAKAAGRLTHPNIVTIYDAGEEQDLAYIAMDYVPGITLNEYTKEKLLLPVRDVYEIIYQAAEALNYAHRQDIIHRDIKPGNIIYNKESRNITVTDFGIARIADTTMTRPGVILGSPSFMSPEQLKGKEIDGRADIFSLGVTMFQLLTGKLPFTGTDLSSLGYQITSVKHASIRSLRPDLPASAEKIINRALQKSPSKRYQTAEGMAKAVKSEISTFE